MSTVQWLIPATWLLYGLVGGLVLADGLGLAGGVVGAGVALARLNRDPQSFVLAVKVFSNRSSGSQMFVHRPGYTKNSDMEIISQNK